MLTVWVASSPGVEYRFARFLTTRVQGACVGSVDAVRLYINGSDDAHVPVVLPEHDPSALIHAEIRVSSRISLSAAEIAAIGLNGTYYDLRVRLYEEDNSFWPWGDDNDDLIWQRRPRLRGVASQVVRVSVRVLVPTLRDYGADYYVGVKLYRRTDLGMSGLHSRRSNTVIIDYL
jgi:hypothetical protein